MSKSKNINSSLQICKDSPVAINTWHHHVKLAVLKGSGRWVGMENHNRLYEEIPKTLALLEDQKIVDQIQIYARPTGLSAPALLYENQLKNGQWMQTQAAVHALTEGRSRTWTSTEESTFLAAAQALATRMRQRGASQADIENFYRYVECPI